MRKLNVISKLCRLALLAAIGAGCLLNVSCSVSSRSMQVLVPADISITKEIKHIGILNYALPSKQNKIIDILEGFVSGESILDDRIGADYCLKGLAEKLNNSPRFSAVIIQGVDLRRDDYRRFSSQLPWNEVKRLCQKYRVDGLIALEHFDSNIHVDKDERMRKKKIKDKETGEKRTIKVPEWHVDLYIEVNSGWKIYDPESQSVIDANFYKDRKSWAASGDTQKEAMGKLPRKRDAINEAGYNSGIEYGVRISPTWTTVKRFYYVKGCKELKEAKRYVRTGDWEGAIAIWKRILQSPDKKLAGRAAYNMAFAAEIKGDFEEAYNWAQKAYSEYGNTKAQSYMRIIQIRIEDEKRLNKQLKN
ncbi:MAG: tetratricopeptide repeat protein [Thermodesulfovibrionales bacterium]|nr:tetratricopeptide repeat protein [Thermodesulfovibrionales bacterium]